MNRFSNNRRAATALIAMLLLLGGCAIPVPVRNVSTHSATPPFINARAIIIVRHADINIADKKTLGDKAPLAARGEDRAKELAFALQDAGINRIITSETLRTQETAAILAEQLHITPETPFSHGITTPLPANAPPTDPAAIAASKKQEAVDVVNYLAQSTKPGDIVLLVHHHSVIPGLMGLLGYNEPPIVENAEFDRVYVVIPDPAKGGYRIMRLRYGGGWGPDHPDLIKSTTKTAP